MEAYRIDECGRMIADSEPDEDSWTPWNAAQSELAALREDLAKCKAQLEHWHSLDMQREQRLTATEQRNVLMSQFLKRMLDGHGMDRLAAWQSEIDMVLADAWDKTTESGASE